MQIALVLRTSLNGRQAKISTTLINDGTSSLAFMDLVLNCSHVGNIFGCGIHPIGSGFNAVVPGGRLTIAPLYGNVLTQSGTYYYSFTGRVGADFNFPVTVASAATAPFACVAATQICKFY